LQKKKNHQLEDVFWGGPGAGAAPQRDCRGLCPPILKKAGGPTVGTKRAVRGGIKKTKNAFVG